MNTTELDEWQGLTPQMVREWLGRHGWVTVCWVPDDFNVDTVGGRERIRFMSDALITIARKENRSIQSLLREINPRMRKGVPSKAALRAHRGLWLRSIGTETIATVLSRLIDEFPSPRDNESYFWPCDEHGNKVRWPTDAEGKML